MRAVRDAIVAQLFLVRRVWSFVGIVRFDQLPNPHSWLPMISTPLRIFIVFAFSFSSAFGTQIDLDGDGMGDVWEQFYNTAGLLPWVFGIFRKWRPA